MSTETRAEATTTSDTETDAPHILPLAMIQLETPALRRARIVKNAQLQGVIELFSGSQTGSGQIPPSELPNVMDMSGGQDADMMIIKRLCSLPSYDVYSLRVSLQELGIKTVDAKMLRVSPECRRRVAKHVRRYTRPMMDRIYGEADADAAQPETLADVFADDRAEKAKANLIWLAHALQIELREMPVFVGDYGDMTSALAFYEYGFEQVEPDLDSFLAALADLREMKYGADNDLVKACISIEKLIRGLQENANALFSYFETKSNEMWRDLSAPAFDKMKLRVRDCYKGLGGGLCAATVKMQAWKDEFPEPDTSSLAARTDFVRRDMLPGLSAMPRLDVLRRKFFEEDQEDPTQVH